MFFSGGNHLEARFPEHPHPLFAVAESGFGTGIKLPDAMAGI